MARVGGADTCGRIVWVASRDSWKYISHREGQRAQPRTHTAALLFQSSSSEDCGVTCAQNYFRGTRVWPAFARGAVAENFGQFQAKRVKWPDRASHTVKDPDSDEPPPLDRFHWPSAIYALFSVIRSPPLFGLRRNEWKRTAKALLLPHIYGKSTTRVTRPRTKMPTNKTHA
jgi:hypothetical protein